MADPRQLDEREQRLWLAFNWMRGHIDAAVERQLTEAGLSTADYRLLVPLLQAPDQRLRARDLRLKVDWDRSRLAHQMRRMEQRGLIAREECRTDARGTVLRLTDEGRRAVEAATPGHVATVRGQFMDLLSPEEIETLTAIAERVVEHARTGPCAAAVEAEACAVEPGACATDPDIGAGLCCDSDDPEHSAPDRDIGKLPA